MGDISEMMLGISASELFDRDFNHLMRNEPFEGDPDPDNQRYLPTLEDCYKDLYDAYNFRY